MSKRALNWNCPSVCLVRRGDKRHWYSPFAPECDCNQLTAIGGKDPAGPRAHRDEDTLSTCDPCQCQKAKQWAKGSASDTPERSLCLLWFPRSMCRCGTDPLSAVKLSNMHVCNKTGNSGRFMKGCQTYHSTYCVFIVLPAKEGSVFHYCRIREDFGLLGADIWLKPCQSIGWLSGIDHCVDRCNCLLVFQSTRLRSTYSAGVNQKTPLARRTLVPLLLNALRVSDIFFFTPSAPADIVYLCLDSLYLFFWTWCYFYSSSALFFMWFTFSDSPLSWFSLYPSLIIHISGEKCACLPLLLYSSSYPGVLQSFTLAP